jgi:hypothetical protein
MIQERDIFAWIGAYSNYGKTTRWIGGLWYVINLHVIIGRFHWVFFVNYGLNLLLVTMPIILTLVNSMGVLLAMIRIEQGLGITY